MNNLKTTIGLEIHVQLKTKSKMFCRCDNNAEGKEPNTVVCPVCLGLPGALPVANEQAIIWTIKTGLALNCEIPKVAKFDRKHYFYPDLPKGYQISQYDEPFAIKGSLKVKSQNEKGEIEEATIRLNRIHLEEDAGKLIHHGNKSFVDLNRAGTPLMEIVTEPDITSPKQAGDFLRKLQKIVRDVVEVSDANMEKGHLRCDANISLCENVKDKTKNEKLRMSPIIELKNINSFRFVEKALTLVEEKLREEYKNWPEKNSKETWGYDSAANKVYLQRKKEEAADYRYFPDPDLPPFDSSKMDLVSLKESISETPEDKIERLTQSGIGEAEAKTLVGDKIKLELFDYIARDVDPKEHSVLAKAIANNYFGFALTSKDVEKAASYAKAIELLAAGKIQKNIFAELAQKIREGEKSFEEIYSEFGSGEDEGEAVLSQIIDKVISTNTNEVARYKAGEKQLAGFFMGQVMKESKGRANPQVVNKVLREKLEK